jgi:hypothetical protein
LVPVVSIGKRDFQNNKKLLQASQESFAGVLAFLAFEVKCLLVRMGEIVDVLNSPFHLYKQRGPFEKFLGIGRSRRSSFGSIFESLFKTGQIVRKLTIGI